MASKAARNAAAAGGERSGDDDVVRDAPRGTAVRRYLAGAAGVHIGGAMCRAAAGFDRGQIVQAPLPSGVGAVCEAIVAAMHRVEDDPRFVVVGTPGHVDRAS